MLDMFIISSVKMLDMFIISSVKIGYFELLFLHAKVTKEIKYFIIIEHVSSQKTENIFHILDQIMVLRVPLGIRHASYFLKGGSLEILTTVPLKKK